MTRSRLLLPVLLAIATALPLQAQGLGAGVSVGAVKLPNGASQTDENGIFGLEPTGWLSINATVSHVHVTQTSGGIPVASDGLGDLPIAVGAAHTFPGAGALELGTSLDLTLPTANSDEGLGTGETALAAGVGIGVAAAPRIRLAAAASRELLGHAGTSALSPTRATSLAFEGQYAITPRWSAALSLAADVGPADSTQGLDRSFGIGTRYQVHGPITLTIDAAHGMTTSSPKWALVIGFGSSFGGNNPASGELSAGRVAHAVSSGVGRGQGTGHVGHGHP